MQRAIHEFVAAVRRAGVSVSTSEVLDAVRAACVLGPESRSDLRHALVSALAKTAVDRGRVAATFERFFAASGATHGDLFARLSAQGFSDEELASLRAVLEANARSSPAGDLLQGLVRGELALDHLLDRAQRRVVSRPSSDRARTGFLTMRLLDAARVPRAETDLAGIRSALRGALGMRGEAMADLLGEELQLLRRRARARVARQFDEDQPQDPLAERPFAQLSPSEITAVEAAVRTLAQRLLGRTAVRARRRRRGRIDTRGTLRQALRTRGVPMELKFRSKPPRRPRLVMLCDVSDSMHASARFMLLFVHAVQRLFSGRPQLRVRERSRRCQRGVQERTRRARHRAGLSWGHRERGGQLPLRPRIFPAPRRARPRARPPHHVARPGVMRAPITSIPGLADLSSGDRPRAPRALVHSRRRGRLDPQRECASRSMLPRSTRCSRCTTYVGSSGRRGPSYASDTMPCAPTRPGFSHPATIAPMGARTWSPVSAHGVADSRGAQGAPGTARGSVFTGLLAYRDQRSGYRLGAEGAKEVAGARTQAALERRAPCVIVRRAMSRARVSQVSTSPI